MADAAAPAPELKEYPEFPGQKLSKRYVFAFLLFFPIVCHHHHHHHPALDFYTSVLGILTFFFSLTYTQNFSEYKKMLKRQKADEEKAAKAAAKVRLQKLLRALSTNSKMRALKPFFVFFFKKLSSFCPPCCDLFIKNSFVFSVLRHMAAANVVVVVGKKKY